MSVARLAVAFLVVAMVLAGGVTALEESFTATGNQATVTNETFNPSSADVIVLAESQRDDVAYDASSEVTVYNTTGVTDTVADEPEDYQWNRNNGTLTINQSGELADDTEANVTYGYLNSTEQKIQAQQLTSLLPRLFGFILPLGLVLAFIMFLT